MTIRVAVQERQRFFREGLVMVLSGEPDVEVVGAVSTAVELTRLCETQRVDVVLLEIDTDDWDPCRLAATIRKRNRGVRVVGLGSRVDPILSMRAQQSGIRSVALRSEGIAGLLQVMRRSAAGGTDVAALAPRPADVQPQRAPALTPRELDVLRLVGAGHTTREVATLLTISPKTVENHKQRMFAKLGVQNQAHAVAVAMRAGLVEPGVALRA